MVIKVQSIKQKHGYKQTEMGMIPEDWGAKSISDLITFSGGSQPPRSTFKFQKKDGYIRLIQIRDYKTNEFETYIPEELARKKCVASDIMIGRYGPPIFQILRGIEGAYNVALMKAIPSPQVDREYLYQFLRQESLFHYIESLSQRSSGQTGVEVPALKKYPFPLPPLLEQRAIAIALSDVDALITSLDRLIAKKRNIKQATMQQLLTGKIRLPGFSEEIKPGYKQTEVGVIPEDWEVHAVEEIADVTTGDKDTQDKTESGAYPFFVRSQTVERINSYAFDGEAVLTAGDGVGVGKVFHYANGKFNFHQRVYMIYNFRKFDGFFFYLYFSNNFSKAATKYNAKNSVDSIRREMVTGMRIPHPPFLEQQAIAAILTDMDAEIVVLEQRRDKTRAIKQGMMQELLTGKTRLL